MALTRPKYSQIYDTDWKQSVDVATVGSDVGNLFAGNLQPSTLDSISLGIGNRILVKDQTNGAQNGLYVVRSVGTGSNGWWVRTLDSNQNSFVTSGLAVSIVSGTINGGKEYKLTTLDPITLDVTALTFINPFAAAGAGGGNAQIQFNDNSILNGTAGLTFNKFSNVLIVGNSISTSTLTTSGNVGIGTAAGNIKLTISSNPVLPSAGPPTDYTSLWGVGADGSAHNMAWDSFGGQMLFIARRANGTAASPTGLISGNPIFQFAARGYGATQYGTSGRAQFTFTAAENWTNTAQGAYITFSTTAIGTTSTLERVRIDDAGNVGIGNIAPLHKLSVSGNVFASGNITAPYFLGNGALLTGIVSGGGGGGTNYSNVNVQSYTETMGFQNYSNVNVAAYTQTQNYTSYSNVNVATYLPTHSGTVGASLINSTGNILSTGLSVFGNTRIGSLATPGALHTIIGNVDVTGAGTEYFNIGGNILAVQASFGSINSTGLINTTGNVSAAIGLFGSLTNTGTSTVGVLNSTGNVLSTGLSVFGNARVGLAGAVSGQFHSFVGNITQTSSGGAVYINTTGNVLLGGNLFVGGGFANIYSPSISTDSALQIVGNVARGGASYHDFLRVTSTASGATNVNKHFRLDGTGNLQIINSAYSATILNLTDAGQLSIGSSIVSTSTTTGALIVTGGVGVGGNLFVGGAVNNPTVTNYTESVVAIGTVTTTNTLSLTNGTVQTATLTASTACVFTMPTATAGKSFILLLKQAAVTGNGTATFTSVKFNSGGAPTITAAAGKMDILSFVADGTNWYGSYTQGYTP
jgi:hypothetical protein